MYFTNIISMNECIPDESSTFDACFVESWNLRKWCNIGFWLFPV